MAAPWIARVRALAIELIGRINIEAQPDLSEDFLNGMAYGIGQLSEAVAALPLETPADDELRAAAEDMVRQAEQQLSARSSAFRRALANLQAALNPDECRWCGGLGEVQGQGRYPDTEPPIISCRECGGSGKSTP